MANKPKMEKLQYDDMKNAWHKIARHTDVAPDPGVELLLYKKIQDIFHIGDYYYYIFNPLKAQIEFIHEKAKEIWGVNDENELSVEYIFSNLHPDDQSRFIAFENKVYNFFINLPPEKALKYKVSFDFRLRKPDGRYIWMLHQAATIQTDELGSVIRSLAIHTDITQIKGDNKPSGLSFIGLEGEPSYHNVPVDQVILIPAQELFTRREKEILRLIVQGNTSQQIAGMLIISLHTVNAHRKKIMRKSGATSMADLLSKTVANGWV